MIKHIWHRISGTNRNFPESRFFDLQCYSVHTVDISPCIPLSHYLRNRYLIISRSCINYQLNYLSNHGYLFIDSVTLSVLSDFFLVTMCTLLNNRAHGVNCLCTGLLKWCARQFVWAFPQTMHSDICSEKSVPGTSVKQLMC